MILNVLKTKEMIFGEPEKETDIVFKCNGDIIEFTEQYKYFGCLFMIIMHTSLDTSNS